MVTFGHGTADATEITRLLRGAQVRRLVDVRTAPGSRHNPDTARAEMERWLPAAGIDYRWEPRLGGWRHGAEDDVDTGLRNKSFRAYAAHMRTPDFRAAVDELLAVDELPAIMCGETVWWRCHRKLVADYLVLARGVEVTHLMHDGRLHEHRPTAEARVVTPSDGTGANDAVLIYDAVIDDPPAG